MTRLLSQRVEFGKTLVDLGGSDSRVVVLDADLATSTQTSMFSKAYPERFFQMGIAEQNMFGVAAGLAAVGLVPFACTFACFVAKRGLDQIRTSVAQPGLNVKLIGAYSGILTGKTGKTHISVQDIAIFRAMPNMITLAPIDGVEVDKAMRAIMDYQGPVYLRLTRDPCPVVLDESYQFAIGKGVLLRDGGDIALIGTGEQSRRCLEAASLLEQEGIDALVLHLPTVKPLDEDAILQAAAKTGVVVTAEEHSLIGGLGGAVAELLGEELPTLVKRVGLRDTYLESGNNDELIEKYGLSPRFIARQARETLKKKKEKD